MKQFIKNILSSDSNVSSKRVAGIAALIAAIGIAITATINSKGLCPEFYFNGLLLFSAGAFGITAMEKIFNKNEETTNTTDITNTTNTGTDITNTTNTGTNG